VTAATLVSLTITPPDSSIAKGTSTQLTATGNFSDGTTQDCTIQVSWTSGNNSIAQVSNAEGTQSLATGLAGGKTTITATLGDVQGSTTLTVTAATLTSIVITPPTLRSPRELFHFVRLTATGTFSDGTTEDLTGQAHWTSNPVSTAVVLNGQVNGGLLIGLNVGNATITVSLNGIEGATTVTLTAATLDAIVVEPRPTARLPMVPVCNLRRSAFFRT
jgi:trimeric autotransporter adhesin